MAQTLAQATAKHHLLIQIQPKAPLLLQDREVTDHVVSTALTLQHRHLQSLHMPPACFHVPSIMPITGELVRIATTARGALPINFAGLPTDLPRVTLASSEFGGHLRSQKRGKDWLHGS